MSRLDLYLVQNGIAKSRERAKEIIKNGDVSVNGKPCTKPSFDVSQQDIVDCTAKPDDLVGRGGLKLKKAFDVFDIDVSGLVCADIGASTGGFTQCLLNKGAKQVYAIDVGHGQLDESLVKDERVINCEGVNARNLESSMFEQVPEFISIDVSFISLSLIIKPASDVLADGGKLVALIKPQFEAGKQALNKKGIVKSPKDHIRIIKELVCVFGNAGLKLCGICSSAVTGGDGNIEYLACLEKCAFDVQTETDVNSLVSEAFNTFRSNGGNL